MPTDPSATDALVTERAFFAALVAGDASSLARILSEDFLLIDVMTGGEIERPALLDAVGSGQLAFERIDPIEARVRVYGDTAVITGRTEMRGRFGGAPFGASSRYTHVFVRDGGGWRLSSAQGTRIAPPSSPA